MAYAYSNLNVDLNCSDSTVSFDLLSISALGAVVLVRTLREFLFPRLGLRMAIRANESSIIDWMWTYTNPMFRATNKTNYATMGVDVTQIRYSLDVPLRNVWLHHRTMSLNGNVGSNIELDRGMEKFNLACAEATRGRVTRDALTKFCKEMNAMSWVESRFRKAIEILNDGESTYSHVRPEDISAVVDYFKQEIGASWLELTSDKPSTLGGAANDVPWEQVRRFHEGVGGRQCTAQCVSDKLRNPILH